MGLYVLEKSLSAVEPGIGGKGFCPGSTIPGSWQ